MRLITGYSLCKKKKKQKKKLDVLTVYGERIAIIWRRAKNGKCLASRSVFPSFSPSLLVRWISVLKQVAIAATQKKKKKISMALS